MCFNVSLVKTAEEIAAFYGINITEIPTLPPEYYNVSGFSHPAIPVVLKSNNGRGISLMAWGLIPSWIKNADDARSIAKKTLNARSETISELPSFKYSWKTKRCIVVTDGFFEPHHGSAAVPESPSRKEQTFPFYIRRKDKGIISLAGLYSSWQNPENNIKISSFSIITAPANTLLEKIHNSKKRMPVILPDSREKLDAWLDPELPEERIEDFFKPRDYSFIEAYPVSKIVYDRKESNSPLAQKPFSYPDLLL